MSRLARSPLVRSGLVLVVLLGVAMAWRLLPVADWVERTMDPIRRAGVWGATIYFVVYVVCVVLLVPGSPLTLAGGYLYGWGPGTLLVSAASTVGATAAFLVARAFGRERIRRWLEGDDRIAAIDRAVAHRGAWVVFLLRLSPAVPFNVLNYALGLTGVRFWPYLLATWVGMIPGTFVYVLVGASGSPISRPAQLGPGSWAAIVITTIVATGYLAWLANGALKRAQDVNVMEEQPR